MADVTGKKRKIDSECSSSDDMKKMRTAEAVTTGDEAGSVMDECSDTLVHSEHSNGTTDGGVSQPATVDISEDNHMSVDVLVKDTTTAAEGDSTQSAAQPSVTDVINIDAIDTESDSDKAESITYGNPQELGLNEYYLQPAGGDSNPAENVIDVDAEDGDDVLESSETAAATEDVSLADGDKCEVGSEHVDEKAGGNETSTESETVSDECPAIVINDGVENTELSGAIPCGNHPSLVVETSQNASSPEQLVKNTSSDNAPGVEDQKTELTVPSSCEDEDVKRLNVADVGEVVAEVIDRVVAAVKCSTDDTRIVEVAPLTAEAGSDTNADVERAQAAAEADVHSLTMPSSLQTEDAAFPGDDGREFAEPVEAECSEENYITDEKLIDSVDAGESGSEVPENISQQATEKDNKTEVTDEASCTAQLKEMTDKTVSNAVFLASMDAVVAEAEETISDEAAVNVDATQEHPKGVQDIGTEVVVNDVKQPSEVIENVEIPLLKDVTDEMDVDTVVVETTKPTAVVADEGIVVQSEVKKVSDGTEVTGDAITNEDHMSPHKDVLASDERSQQPAETDNDEDVENMEMKDMAVTAAEQETQNAFMIDDSMPQPDIKDMKHMTVTEDDLQASVADKMVTAENDVKITENVTSMACGDDAAEASEETTGLNGADESKQLISEVVDKVAADAEAMQMTNTCVIDEDIDDIASAKSAKKGTSEVVPTADAAAEIVVGETEQQDG